MRHLSITQTAQGFDLGGFHFDTWNEAVTGLLALKAKSPPDITFDMTGIEYRPKLQAFRVDPSKGRVVHEIIGKSFPGSYFAFYEHPDLDLLNQQVSEGDDFQIIGTNIATIKVNGKKKIKPSVGGIRWGWRKGPMVEVESKSPAEALTVLKATIDYLARARTEFKGEG